MIHRYRTERRIASTIKNSIRKIHILRKRKDFFLSCVVLLSTFMVYIEFEIIMHTNYKIVKRHIIIFVPETMKL